MVDRKQVESLAEIVGLTAEQVESEIQELMRQGMDELPAIVKWKSDHSLQMGRSKPQELRLRIIGREGSSTANLEDGSTSAGTLYAIYKAEGDQVGFAMAKLWGDRAAQADKVRIGEVWSANGAIEEGPTTSLLRALSLKDKIAADSVPTIEQMVASGWEIDKLEDIHDYAGANMAIFKGMVGKPIEINGRRAGIEMANPYDASVPVAFWGGRGPSRPAVQEVQDAINTANIGDWLYACASVYQKNDGNLSVTALGFTRA